jgi:hypothetical protein
MMSTKTGTKITAKGRQLADNLNPVMGTTTEIQRTCSLIARHATTLHKLSEIECNGSFDWMQRGETLSDDQWEWVAQRRETLEARIRNLVDSLPHTEDGPITVRFNGDPRGAAVKLSAPGESHALLTKCKDWGDELPV